MQKTKINIGDVFGLYAVVRELKTQKDSKGRYIKKLECRCSCGNTRVVSSGNLKNGNSKSCGCRVRSHSRTNSPEWITWRGMKARCSNPKATGYSRYGGAGIQVCSRWESFDSFYEDMGPRPAGCTLDRKDGSKGYEPENCKWSTKREQCNNRKNNVRIEFEGETRTVAEWARHIGLKHVTLKQRLRHGWPVDRALKALQMLKGK